MSQSLSHSHSCTPNDVPMCSKSSAPRGQPKYFHQSIIFTRTHNQTNKIGESLSASDMLTSPIAMSSHPRQCPCNPCRPTKPHLLYARSNLISTDAKIIDANDSVKFTAHLCRRGESETDISSTSIISRMQKGSVKFQISPLFHDPAFTFPLSMAPLTHAMRCLSRLAKRSFLGRSGN